MKRIDINVDIGEGFPYDEALLDYATSANVCCGAHAGSLELTKETLFLCERKGVRIGMHPGFPDRETMGRARMNNDEVRQYANSILEQALCFRNLTLDTAYVKPHGAWYNMLCDRQPPDSSLLVACHLMLLGVLAAVPVSVMLLEGCPITQSLERESIRIINEGFADRGYAQDGALLPRGTGGAVISDRGQIKDQVLRLAPEVDSLCIHGDTPDCVGIAELVYGTLEEAGFEVGY